MNEFPQWLDEELNRRGWTAAELAKRARVNTGSLSRILTRDRNAGPDLCRVIAKALGEPEEKIFRLAGLLSPLPSPDDPAIEEINSLIKNLSPDRRQQVLEYVRFMSQQQRKP